MGVRLATRSEPKRASWLPIGKNRVLRIAGSAPGIVSRTMQIRNGTSWRAREPKDSRHCVALVVKAATVQSAAQASHIAGMMMRIGASCIVIRVLNWYDPRINRSCDNRGRTSGGVTKWAKFSA